MSKIEKFLSSTEEQEIVEAIRLAELDTSGEIRVHLEKSAKGDVTPRALELFHTLKMDNTKLRNAVLIYVAIEDKTFAIYGDKGINTVVGDNFWDSTKDSILTHFKKGYFKQGLVDGIRKVGLQLKTYFPYTSDDTNELSNDISKG
jgi:uncharacterized membrane protein